jgi:hypothetical protein
MKNNQPERIICSAIWYKELPLKRPEVLQNRGIAPYNVDRGVVFCGWRHPNCMYQMVAITGLRSVESEVGEYVQGFLTNKNRFVDRKDGAEIALKENQIINMDRFNPNMLFSEDLY